MHEALTAALAERVDAEVPLSVMRELGSQEYQAKLLEAQARVRLIEMQRVSDPVDYDA